MSPNRYKPWTPHQDQELRNCISEGSSYRETARFLGRTCAGVEWRCRQLGIRCPAKYHRDIDRRVLVLALIGQGLTLTQIGKRIERNPAQVSRVVAEFVRGGIVRATGRTNNKRFVVVTNDYDLFRE